MKKLLFITLAMTAIACNGQDPGIANYFSSLCNKYMDGFALRELKEWSEFCKQTDVDSKDLVTMRKFYTILIMHQLLTTVACSNGAAGNILNIPYFWHYCTPNPRDKILTNGQYRKWNSRAERVPHIFLGDLVATSVKYSYPGIEPFSTFGWCSEREMSYACMIRLMGYRCWVIAPSNHAWTEVQIPVRMLSGAIDTVLVRVDNTFNRLTYAKAGFATHNNIYSDSGLNMNEVAQVRALQVGKAARERIDKAVEDYLKSKPIAY